MFQTLTISVSYVNRMLNACPKNVSTSQPLHLQNGYGCRKLFHTYLLHMGLFDIEICSKHEIPADFEIGRTISFPFHED